MLYICIIFYYHYFYNVCLYTFNDCIIHTLEAASQTLKCFVLLLQKVFAEIHLEVHKNTSVMFIITQYDCATR